LIFYDDPTAGLDPITSRKIIELILQLKKEEKATIVAITNDMNRAYQLADRMVLVVSKQIIETGNPEQTKQFSDERVQQFIHGRVQGPITAMG
jgi:phospholipid/cholesterol/gamma-HCH transport system ATP-binding protein